MSDLTVDGMALAPGVVETIVSIAANEVEGVASVGSAAAGGLRSVFGAKPSTQGIDIAVDEDDKLVGVFSLRDLMLSKPGTILRDSLHDQDVIAVRYDTPSEEVARRMSHYNFMAMPVVDYEGRLLGVATYDDILDIMQDEASADLLGMVGAGQDETVDTPWLESVQIRLPWLIVNMLTSMMSAFVVYMFEGSIAGMALLAVLMPMVANQAGNTGQQALAVMIRQLATEKFDRRRAWIAVLREGKIMLNGTPEEVLTQDAELRKLNLDIPFATQLSRLLQDKGIDIPTFVDREPLKEALWLLYSNTSATPTRL